MDSDEVDPYRILQESGQCFVVWHFYQLDFEWITISTIHHGVAGNKTSAVVRQQREHCVFEGSKVFSAFVPFPQQDAQA